MANSSSLVGLLQFPGSNCEGDCSLALSKYFNIQPVAIWHNQVTLPKIRGLILPGGFSFGDYLRSGYLACLSPLMPAIKAFAEKGGAILGICNGFQILTAAKLLPGTLLANLPANFICRPVRLKIEPGPSVYQARARQQQDGTGPAGLHHTLQLPIAHGQGRYYCASSTLQRLEERQQIVYRYEDAVNGSLAGIAGLCSENGKILGLMPHPERAVDPLLGSCDGLSVLEDFLATFL